MALTTISTAAHFDYAFMLRPKHIRKGEVDVMLAGGSEAADHADGLLDL